MKPIVPNEKCLTQEQILRYLRDDCQPDEVRSIDKHLSHCPMCSDAMEGAMMLDTKELEFAWVQSQAHIKSRTEELTTEVPTTPTIKRRSGSIRFLRFALGAAASVAILATAAIWLITKPLEKEESAVNMATTESASADSAYFTQKPEVIEPSSQSEQPLASANTQSKTSGSNEFSPSAPPLAPSVTTSAVPVNEDTVASNAVAVASSPRSENTTKESANRAADKIEDFASAPPAAVEESKRYQSADYERTAMKKERSAQAAMAKKSKNIVADDNAILENGTNFLRNNQYNEALSSFNSLINKTPKSNQYEQALWYYANALLKIGNKTASKATYMRIAKERGKYAAQAENILSTWKD